MEGAPEETCFTEDAPIGKITNSKWGVGEGIRSPKRATTDFKLIGSDEGRSLLKAIPRSGRTNQIRVHLQLRGLPVWNDPVYGIGKEHPATQMGLHAYRLRFKCLDHYKDITAPWPKHFESFVERF